MTPSRLNPLLQQFDFALDRAITRLDGMSDDEYLWEPVDGCWSIRERGKPAGNRAYGAGGWRLEFNVPPPEPEPFTTIAWRLSHLACGLAMRADYTIGSKQMGRDDFVIPASADAGISTLVSSGVAWREALTSADDAALDEVGRSSFPWGLDPDLPFLDICWWVNQEVLHHGAELALLRDLYRARPMRH
jgi:hypothetical protein